MARKTLTDVRRAKGSTPLVVLTAYTAPMAALLDSYCDILLVGDSLGMVIYGYETTLPVTPAMMIAHGEAVQRASKQALVVVDMPFGSYQASPRDAFRVAARILQQTGAAAVKLEGGVVMAETIRYLTERGVAVMAHIGLQPQSVHQDGGYYCHGKTPEEHARILADAKAVEAAGAFTVVLEGITASLADEITQVLTIPTIGIGASVGCDGQVLVTEDMLGLTARAPRFAKRYALLGEGVEQAVEAYAQDVRARRFPGKEHVV